MGRLNLMRQTIVGWAASAIAPCQFSIMLRCFPQASTGVVNGSADVGKATLTKKMLGLAILAKICGPKATEV